MLEQDEVEYWLRMQVLEQAGFIESGSFVVAVKPEAASDEQWLEALDRARKVGTPV